MELFITIIDAGGISAAARQLGITHSAISKRISRLEHRLKCQLLVRTTRGITATEAGLRYYGETKTIVEQIRLIESDMMNESKIPHGTLKVSASNAFGRLRIVPATIEFMKKNPAVNVDLTLTDKIVDLEKDRFDVAIRSGTLGDSSLIARKLTANERIICASPEYLSKAGLPQNVDDLKKHHCLNLNFPSSFDTWEFIGGRQGNANCQIAFSCNSVEALYMACMAGVGIARLPEFLVKEDLSAGRLISLLNDSRLSTGSSIYAVRLPTNILPAKTRSYIDHLLKWFNTEN